MAHNVGRAGFLWSGEAYTSDARRSADLTLAEGNDPSQPSRSCQCRSRPRQSAGCPRSISAPDGVYTLFTIYSTIMPETIGKGSIF
jgi:predicted sulfurtransferase